MQIHLPQPQPDQTMESLAALTAIGNGLYGTGAAVRMFGLKTQKNMGSPFHNGTGTLFRELADAGFGSCQDLLDRHGRVRLFQPFMQVALYEQACQKLIQDNFRGITALLGITGISPFSKEWRYCKCCMSTQIETLGYAFPRCSDQVQAKMMCSVHATPLVTLESVPEQVKLMWGLVASPHVPNFRDGWKFGQSTYVEVNEAEKALGPWVDAAFSGVLHHARAEVRVQLILSKLAAQLALPQRQKALPGKLENLVRNNYSSAYLEHVGLPLAYSGTAHWPAMLAGASAFVDHPIANLLVMALLFKSPSEFNRLATESTDHNPRKHQPRIHHRGTPKITWGFGLLKDVLRSHSLEDVAAKHGLRINTLKDRLQEYPEIRRRRKQYLANQNQLRIRKSLTEALNLDPSLRRSQFRKSHSCSYKWLIKYDCKWFMDVLPPTDRSAKHYREKLNRAQQTDQSQRIIMVLTGVATTVKECKVPTRVTKKRLIEALGYFDAQNLSSGFHPAAQQEIDELVEDWSRFATRVLGQLDKLIEKNDIPASKLWAIQLIQMFSHRADVIRKIVDKLTTISQMPVQHEVEGSAALVA